MKTTKRNASAVVLALVTLLGVGACTNPDTPAGHEGYVFYTPLIFGKMEYRKTLHGPASTGISWRLFVTNVDMRAKNYKEPFKLLTKDNLSVAFEVSTRLQLRRGSVQEVVEQWGGEKWYAWNVKEPLRTVVRTEVMKVNASVIQSRNDLVRGHIMATLKKKYQGTPVEILSVDIGHIQFPKRVTDAIQSKISKQQELARQRYVLAKAKKEAAIYVLEALKVAKQQQIISSTLDPLYVQRKAVQVYRKLAASKNKTILVLPMSPDGTGMPLVVSSSKRKILTAADKRLLKRMEATYMAMAASGNVDMTNTPKLEGDSAPKPGADGAPAKPAPVKPAPAKPAPAPAPAP